MKKTIMAFEGKNQTRILVIYPEVERYTFIKVDNSPELSELLESVRFAKVTMKKIEEEKLSLYCTGWDSKIVFVFEHMDFVKSLSVSEEIEIVEEIEVIEETRMGFVEESHLWNYELEVEELAFWKSQLKATFNAKKTKRILSKIEGLEKKIEWFEGAYPQHAPVVEGEEKLKSFRADFTSNGYSGMQIVKAKNIKEAIEMVRTDIKEKGCLMESCKIQEVVKSLTREERIALSGTFWK